MIEHQNFYYEGDEQHTIDAYPKITKLKIVEDKSMLNVFRKTKKKLWGKIQYVEKINKHRKRIWLRQTDDEKIAHKVIEIVEVKYKWDDKEFIKQKDPNDFELIDNA